MKRPSPLRMVLFTFLICIPVGRWTAGIGSSAQQMPSYEQWIAAYRRGPLQMDYGAIRTSNAQVGPAPVVVITAIEGDDLTPDERNAAMFGQDYRVVTYGCSVSSEGRVSYFQHRFDDSKGSGYPVIPKEDLQRLETLAAKLPDDHSQLPPAGRRLVVQVPDGNGVQARVYDRANLPGEILEILRLSGSGITSWALKFDPQSKWQTGTPSYFGYDAVAVSLDGKQIITVQLDGSISTWDAASHALKKSVPYSFMPLPGNFTESPAPPHHLMFSPDGAAAIVGDYGDLDVRNPDNWQGIKKLRPDSRQPGLLHPQFSVDGRYLFVESELPELQIFDTKTWQRHGPLPEIPLDAVAYLPSSNRKRAIYLSKTRAIKLWNVSKRHDVAELDDNARIVEASFSPDQSMVALVIAHDNIQFQQSTVRDYKIGIWRTDNGEFMHELFPFEEPAHSAGDLRWWPDSKYVMAAISTAVMFGEQGIGLWEAKSGRFRGEFTGCGDMGFVILPQRQQLVGLCGHGAVAIWDGAKAINQVEQFPAFASK